MRISTSAQGQHKDWDFEPEMMLDKQDMQDSLQELSTYLLELSEGEDLQDPLAPTRHYDGGGPLDSQLESLVILAFTTGQNQSRTWAIGEHEDVALYLALDDEDHKFAKAHGLFRN